MYNPPQQLMATYRSVAVNFSFLKNSKLGASMWDTEKGCHGVLTAYWLSVRVRGLRGSGESAHECPVFCLNTTPSVKFRKLV